MSQSPNKKKLTLAYDLFFLIVICAIIVTVTHYILDVPKNEKIERLDLLVGPSTLIVPEIHNKVAKLSEMTIGEPVPSIKPQPIPKIGQNPGNPATGAKSRGGPIEQSISWLNFTALPQFEYTTTIALALEEAKGFLKLCPQANVDALIKPALSDKDFHWCKWTLSPSGGNVVVGKSYGVLNGKEREQYEQLNCNMVSKGFNPTCDSAWGDGQIRYWKEHPVPHDLCQGGDHSRTTIQCFDSQSNARFCMFDNIMMDFSKMHNTKRQGRSDSRSWDKGFLKSDCKPGSDIDYYSFYAPDIDPMTDTCDVYIQETVVVISHDDIHNLGHSMSDFMGVWAEMWLAGVAQHTKEIYLLNVDAIRMGHNYYDVPNAFFRVYDLAFKSVLKASDFGSNAKVCFKKLIFMPRPVILFTWDGWWQDMKCSFVGPSSLFQRWNVIVRQNYGLLTEKYLTSPNTQWRILLVLRRNSRRGSQYSSRVFSNEQAIVETLKTIPNAELVVRDLAAMPFEEQVRLIASCSVLIGMHGAGVASAMHMAVGTKFCCGVVEIFPQGEFRPIRGYGNMARRMGHHYARLEIGGEGEGGSSVPPQELLSITKEIMTKIEIAQSCILPQVMNDPFFTEVTQAQDQRNKKLGVL